MEMMTKEEKIRADGFEIENARITNVSLNFRDYSVLTLQITLKGDHWGCNFGGYALGTGCLGAEVFEGDGKGLEAIMRIMDTVGVEALEDMKGKIVRVAHKGTGSWSVDWIGNVIEDHWFSYKEFYGDSNG